MNATASQFRPNAVIQARVFRGKPAPRMFPALLWNFLRRKRFPGTGRWENLGDIASTEKGSATVNFATR